MDGGFSLADELSTRSARGGGASAALMRLPHGKDGYPDNPTVAPATKADKAGASLLIADDYNKAVAVPKG